MSSDVVLKCVTGEKELTVKTSSSPSSLSFWSAVDEVVEPVDRTATKAHEDFWMETFSRLL